MNKKLFYDIFPSLSSLKLDVGSVKEITLPITKKSLRTLSIETKHDLEMINVDNSMPPIKNKFKVHMHCPSPRFEHCFKHLFQEIHTYLGSISSKDIYAKDSEKRKHW